MTSAGWCYALLAITLLLLTAAIAYNTNGINRLMHQVQQLEYRVNTLLTIQTAKAATQRVNGEKVTQLGVRDDDVDAER